MNNHEVKVALVADDQTSDTLKKVSHALGNVAAGHAHANAQAKAHGGLWDNVKSTALGTALTGAAGFAFQQGVAAIHKGWEEVREAITEGTGGIEAGRSLAGVLMMTDTSGASFERLSDKAWIFKNDLEEIAIEAGVTSDAMNDVFEGIAARSNKSAVEVEELTASIGQAGRAVRGGAGAIGSGFEMMQMGMVRAKNPVVQLIAATGTLHGNAKSVAAQLQKMTPEKQMKLGEQAIEKMAKKMKDVPATWAQAITGITSIKGQILESFGNPLVKELVPHLIQVRDFLNENKDELFQYGAQLANKVIKIGKETYDWGKTLWDQVNTADVRNALKDGAEALTFAFDIMHTVTKTAWSGLSVVVGKLAESYQGWKTLFSEAREFGVFGEQGKRNLLEGKRDEHKKDAKEQAEFAANPEYRKAAQLALDEMAATNSKILASQQAQYDKSSIWNAITGAQRPTEIDPDMEVAYKNLKLQIEDAQRQGEEASRVVAQNDETKFATMYKGAAERHDEGLQFYMAKLLSGNEKLQDSLIKGGFGLEGAFSEIADRMAHTQGVTKETAGKFVAKVKASGEKSGAPVVNFNGGQKFEIKQDFRDQDPDRVAAVFRKDVLKAASARVQSRYARGLVF